jgi:hypothetical protein
MEKDLARAAKTLLSLGAPDSVWCARLALVNWLLSGTQRRRTAIIHRTVWWCTGLSGGAPDCPVHQSTEGKNCLSGLLSTAPCCLGAIKGTPRRMKEYTKHTLSILDHSHSVFAHSIGILSDLSSVLVVNLVLFI